MRHALWFVGLAVLQVLFLNQIHWFGVATPFLYVYFILILERDIPKNGLLLIAFFLGLTIDIFCNTPGVNAAATVLLAFIRPGLIRLFSPRDAFDNFEPSIRVLGFGPFSRYLLVGIAIHHSTLFLLETFSVQHIKFLALRIVCSTLLTFVFALTLAYFRHRKE